MGRSKYEIWAFNDRRWIIEHVITIYQMTLSPRPAIQENILPTQFAGAVIKVLVL